MASENTITLTRRIIELLIILRSGKKAYRRTLSESLNCSEKTIDRLMMVMGDYYPIQKEKQGRRVFWRWIGANDTERSFAKSEHLAKIYDAGFSLSEVGEFFNLTSEAVRLRLNKINHPTRSDKLHSHPDYVPAWHDITKEQILELYEKQKLNQTQTRKKLGIHHASFKTLLEKYQIPVRKQTRPRTDKTSEKWLRRAYLELGRSRQSIADELNCSIAKIDQLLRRYSIFKPLDQRKNANKK